MIFKRLTGGSVALRAHSLILISSLKVVVTGEEASSLVFNSWILSNIGFLSKSSRAESVFAVISLKIRRSFTLMTLFCFST